MQIDRMHIDLMLIDRMQIDATDPAAGTDPTFQGERLMKRMFKTAAAVKLSALLLALAAPGAAFAATEAYIDCSLQSNACFGDAYSDSGPITFHYQFDYVGVDAIFPEDCSNQNYCRFYCIRNPGPINARVIAYDANYQMVAATEWVTAQCTQQDILLP